LIHINVSAVPILIQINALIWLALLGVLCSEVVAVAPDAVLEPIRPAVGANHDAGLGQLVDRLAGHAEPARQHRRGHGVRVVAGHRNFRFIVRSRQRRGVIA